MRKDAITLEEERLKQVQELEDYPNFHERHRIFPEVFEDRQHTRIIDLSAGVGCVAKNIKDQYSTNCICNDISPKCLCILKNLGMTTTSFDIDDNNVAFPFPEEQFDAVISLATIEHLIHCDSFLQECYRILKRDGYLYISTPNYASWIYFPRFVFAGKTFHDPLSNSARIRYEFFAHVRYFTYQSLVEFASAFGFSLDTVYLALPKGSTKYLELLAQSKTKATIYRTVMWFQYHLLSPRWASEPIICFRKVIEPQHHKYRKVIL